MRDIFFFFLMVMTTEGNRVFFFPTLSLFCPFLLFFCSPQKNKKNQNSPTDTIEQCTALFIEKK